jgi:hypothetical protein
MMDAHKQSDESPAEPVRIELKGLFAMMLGVWYPRNYVVAAIDPSREHATVASLLSAGFGANAIRHENGEKVLQIRATIKAQRTPLQRAAVTVSNAVTDEGLMSQQYFAAAELGYSLVAVLAPEPHLAAAAAHVLHAHEGRHVRFYGDKTIADL